MPQLYTRGIGSCLERKVKMRPNYFDREVCGTIYKEPKVRVPYSREAAVKPCGKTESGYTILDMAQITGKNTVKTENEESEFYVLISKKDISKRKKIGIFV